MIVVIVNVRYWPPPATYELPFIAGLDTEGEMRWHPVFTS